ncbi:biliverdin-producing heme oxygenase [Arthrobacter ginkgonis]|uniref:Biliverdin-producing heme oxygenase n=1 Tax=Arthrobacter ginkgonis TaxID=1630594 RepID=A0ABP7D9A4_9MICC
MTETPETTFSARLRHATQAEHSRAESAEFISTLMEGTRSARDYALLLSQYRFIYSALEEECRSLRERPGAGDLLAELLDPRLERLPSIEADLAGLVPAVGLDAAPGALPATREYAARIRAAAAEDPARLVAHHYLRYLGDLSGGLAIGRLVARHYGIVPEHLSMWTFHGIDKPKVYKDGYRAKLDAYAVDDARADALVDEAASGFALNRALFAELLGLSRKVAPAVA